MGASTSWPVESLYSSHPSASVYSVSFWSRKKVNSIAFIGGARRARGRRASVISAGALRRYVEAQDLHRRDESCVSCALRGQERMSLSWPEAVAHHLALSCDPLAAATGAHMSG